MKTAKIEVWTRDVKVPFEIPILGKGQHLFIIHTNSGGDRTILRGGPQNDNMLLDNIKIIQSPYTKFIDGKQVYDWFPDAPRIIIAEGTDEEMQALVDKMWTKAQEINQGNYDYKLPTFGMPDKVLSMLLNSNSLYLSDIENEHLNQNRAKPEEYFSFSHVQNSNTAVKLMVEAAGLQLKLPKHHDGTEIWVPGIESNEFKHTVIDGLLRQLSEKFSVSKTKYIDLESENQYDPLNMFGSILEFAVADDTEKLKTIIHLIKFFQSFDRKQEKLNQPEQQIPENIKNKEYLDSKYLNICTEKFCKSELYDALLQNDDEKFILALEKGINPNSGFLFHSTGAYTAPISLASNKGKFFYVEKLIEYGAEVNINKMLDIDHVSQRTPLIAAVEYNYIDIAVLLLDAGATPDLLIQYSALFEALSRKYYAMAKLLLDYGANPDSGGIFHFYTYDQKEITYHHKTPLYNAIENKDITAIEMLLTNGACINEGVYEVYNYKTDIKIESAYELAQRSSLPMIKALIEFFPCNEFTHNNLDEAYEILHGLVNQ